MGVISYRKEIVPTKGQTLFSRVSLSREAIKKSKKLFPFVQIDEKHGGVPIHLNLKVLSGALLSRR